MSALPKTAEAAMLGLIIFMSSVFRGGNRNMAMAMLLLLAMGLLSLILADILSSKRDWKKLGAFQHDHSIPGPWWRSVLIIIVVASPLYIALMQTRPEWYVLLAKYGNTGLESIVHPGNQVAKMIGLQNLSLLPEATITSAMCGVIVAIVFVAVLRTDTKLLPKIMVVWIAVAILQISLICFQLAGGRESWAYFNSDFRSARASIGTLNSRNTIAGYFAACFPLFVWYCFHCRRSAWASQKLKSISFAIAVAALTSLILLSFSLQSRGGLVSFMISAACTFATVGVYNMRKSKGRTAALHIAVGVIVLLGASLLVGWDIVGQRFSVQDPIRQQLFSSAWNGALQLLPFGSGLGSFGFVYPIFQPVGLVGYFSLAHNDYIQLIFEVGYFSVIAVAAVLALLVSSMWQLLLRPDKRSELGDEKSLKFFALSSLTALAFHSTVEFNMHIPLMAILFGFIVGIIVRLPDGLISER